MNEIGLSKQKLGLLVALAATLPAIAAFLAGADWSVVAIVYGGSCATVGGLVAIALSFLHRSLLGPLWAMLKSLDELRAGGGPGKPVREAGAPMLRNLLRKFTQTCETVHNREQMSRAKLLTVEVAFDRVHSVVQALSEGVVVVGVDCRVVLANSAARAMLPGAEELVGTRLTELVTDELHDSLIDGLQRIADGKAEKVDVTDLTFGERIFNLAIAQLHSPRPDQNFGNVVVLADVTKDHELARLKDEFLSSVSHELRTPLTNICSFTEILSDMSPQSEKQDWDEFLGIVNGESQRMKGLVDDLLEYSQIEIGQLEIRPERMELSGVVAEAVEMFSSTATEKNIEIERQVGDDSLVWADHERVRQVLCRLVENGLKFTPKGGRLRIEAERHVDGIVISVHDSGVGVDPEHRDSVFDKFSQLGDLMTGKPGGTGLGLPICRRVIEAMGGSIWCDASELGGACFGFVLPTRAPATVVSADEVDVTTGEAAS